MAGCESGLHCTSRCSGSASYISRTWLPSPQQCDTMPMEVKQRHKQPTGQKPPRPGPLAMDSEQVGQWVSTPGGSETALIHKPHDSVARVTQGASPQLCRPRGRAVPRCRAHRGRRRAPQVAPSSGQAPLLWHVQATAKCPFVNWAAQAQVPSRQHKRIAGHQGAQWLCAQWLCPAAER